ncbi:MAG TPA: glycosyltransferase family 2 protein [Solirubrobacteraceae bacterium]|jgi:GT2 family glycosyltransferase|nr:glycosyltransferase family 2 protein [Solirubrobacteraceae bacterium]
MSSMGAVILSFGHEQCFDELLAVMAAELGPGNVVLAHNPYDPTDTWMPTLPREVRAIRMPDNVGYAAAMNAGVEALATDWVWLLTHDVIAAPDAVHAVRERIAQLPTDAGIAGVCVARTDGIRAYGTSFDQNGLGTINTAEPESPTIDVEMVDGCAMLVRRTAWKQLGGLWPGYFMYFEEIEYSDRARKAGWRTILVSDIEITSSPGYSRRPGAYGFLMSRNGYDWALRCRGRATASRFAFAQIRIAWRRLPRHKHQLRPKRFEAALLMATGHLLGLSAALFGRRSGRPPSYLLRRTDIAAQHQHS